MIKYSKHKFIGNGVNQCWSCANRDGITPKWVDDMRFDLPECKVMQMAMTVVYNYPCRAYKPIYPKHEED